MNDQCRDSQTENGHAQLRTDLENLHGEDVWVGSDFEMPSEYWKENMATDALIAVKGKEE